MIQRVQTIAHDFIGIIHPKKYANEYSTDYALKTCAADTMMEMR